MRTNQLSCHNFLWFENFENCWRTKNVIHALEVHCTDLRTLELLSHRIFLGVGAFFAA